MSLWRPHTTAILISGILLILVAIAVSFMVTHFKPTTDLRMGSGVFNARVAADEPSRVMGLSGVKEMKPNDALIMAFPSDDYWGIWMKEMFVPLDIVWLDKNKQVIYIVKDARPELGESKTFRPKDPARYVIEVPAGATTQNDVTVGETVVFDLAEEVR
jgi:uncharacterized membrane protein (UPF0127 family)